MDPTQRELDFLAVQLRVLQDEAGPHYRNGMGAAIARIHKRMDELTASQRLCQKRRGRLARRSVG